MWDLEPEAAYTMLTSFIFHGGILGVTMDGVIMYEYMDFSQSGFTTRSIVAWIVVSGCVPNFPRSSGGDVDTGDTPYLTTTYSTQIEPLSLAGDMARIFPGALMRNRDAFHQHTRQ